GGGRAADAVADEEAERVAAGRHGAGVPEERGEGVPAEVREDLLAVDTELEGDRGVERAAGVHLDVRRAGDRGALRRAEERRRQRRGDRDRAGGRRGRAGAVADRQTQGVRAGRQPARLPVEGRGGGGAGDREELVAVHGQRERDWRGGGAAGRHADG